MTDEPRFAMRTPLTREQHNDLWRCIREWERIRRMEAIAAEHPVSSPRLVDIEKSCLLGRLTMAGKDPLAFPPPTCFAAPWYDLIENGYADLPAFMVYGPHAEGGESFFSIGSCRWSVVRVDNIAYVLNWPNYGEWLLRHRNVIDPVVQSGRRLMPSGEWEDTYLTEADWRLERTDG